MGRAGEGDELGRRWVVELWNWRGVVAITIFNCEVEIARWTCALRSVKSWVGGWKDTVVKVVR